MKYSEMECERGSAEAMEWIRNYYHPRQLPPVIGSVYDFVIYRRIIRTCNDEHIWQMNEYVKQHGMRKGITYIVNKIRSELLVDNAVKKTYVNRLVEEEKRAAVVDKINRQQMEKELKELDREVGLTDEQLQKRNSSYPGGIYQIPRTELSNQPIIERGSIDDKIPYEIHDKIYRCYSAVVYFPHKSESLLVRNLDLDNLKDWVKIYADKEILSEKLNFENTNNKLSSQDQNRLDNVKRNFGFGNDLNGDIF